MPTFTADDDQYLRENWPPYRRKSPEHRNARAAVLNHFGQRGVTESQLYEHLAELGLSNQQTRTDRNTLVIARISRLEERVARLEQQRPSSAVPTIEAIKARLRDGS